MKYCNSVCAVIVVGLSLFVCSGLCLCWDSALPALLRNVKQSVKDAAPCQSFPILAVLPTTPLPPTLVEIINALDGNISLLVKETQTPSLTINLVYDQTIIWSQSYGVKQLNSSNPEVPNGDTIYRIGSNSKVFAGLLMMIGKDMGLFSLDDEVSKYVPAFAPPIPFPSKKSITFAQLASHMAGMPRESPCEALFGSCNFTNAQMWQAMEDMVIVQPPGLIPSYSNAGISTLAHVLEEIMGDTYENLVQKYILEPLGMPNTGFTFTYDVVSKMAVGYQGTNVAPLVDIGWEGPAGQMYSTANDMAKLMQFFFRDDVPYMYQNNQILDSQTIRDWRRPNFVNSDLSAFGMPWEIYSAPIIYTKGGAITGYLSEFVTVPDLRFGSMILQSSDSSPAINIALGAFFTAIVPFAQVIASLEPPPKFPNNFKLYLGTYSFGPVNATITLGTVPNSIHPQIVAFLPGSSMVLTWISDLMFLANYQGMTPLCQTLEGGTIEYVYFHASNPLSVTLPGLYPGVTAYMTM